MATLGRCPRHVRFPPDSDQIADAPTRRINALRSLPRTLVSPKSTNARQRARDTDTNEAPMRPVETKRTLVAQAGSRQLM